MEIKTKNKIAYLLIAFYTGIVSLADLAVLYSLKDILFLSPGETSRLIAFGALAWALKPLYGLISDFIPIFSYRRKYYILICSFANVIFFFILASTTNYYKFLICLFMIQMNKGFLSVLSQAILIESNSKSSFEEIKSSIGNCFLVKHLGNLGGSALRGTLIQFYPISIVFKIAAYTSIINILAFILYEENINDIEITDCENKNEKNTIKFKSLESNLKHPLFEDKEVKKSLSSPQKLENEDKNNTTLENEILMSYFKPENRKDSGQSKNRKKSYHSYDQNNNNNNKMLTETLLGEDVQVENKIGMKHKLNELYEMILNKDFYIPISLIIVFFSIPMYNDPMFYFITNKLHYKPWILTILAVANSGGICIAIFLYIHWFKIYSSKLLIFYSTICLFLFGSLSYVLVMRWNIEIGISDYTMSILSNLLMSIFSEIMMLPLLSVAASICPVKLEGTIYSLFMSAFSISFFFSGIFSSILTDKLGITSTNFDNFHILILICNFFIIFPLIYLKSISDKYLDKENIIPLEP